MQAQHKITYKTIINAPKEKVWDALTNPDIIKQYFFGTELITSWEIGSEIIFQGSWEGQSYRDKGTILEYIKDEKLAYSYLSNWSGKEDLPENYLWVSYEVKEISGDTELTIYQTNYDEEKAQHSEASWASIIDGMKSVIL
jgi:uncharacterized protein YndB with AHSA1/START domain